MATIYTVSQLNNEIKDLLDAVPGYRGLMVQGEISNYKAHSSGHHYMTLKDENAAINAVMFRSDAMRLKFRLQNGMKVIVKARVSSFPRTGAVQLYVSEIIPDGAGALNLAFEQLKAKLQAEGLFSERYKKPIPSCPDSIALVTSPTGAAVRDIRPEGGGFLLTLPDGQALSLDAREFDALADFFDAGGKPYRADGEITFRFDAPHEVVTLDGHAALRFTGCPILTGMDADGAHEADFAALPMTLCIRNGEFRYACGALTAE